MRLQPPAFWETQEARGSGALTRTLLSPLGSIYAWATARRIRTTTPFKAGIPVICIGNLTLGGTGKTPVTQSLRALLKAEDISAHTLSRGWKGSLSGPDQVDLETHTAADTGDEPLMLAQDGPAWVAKDRASGASVIQRSGADIILMDDGHQNPTLFKDLSLIVVDAETGWGSGRVFPAGPLREPVQTGLARADGIIIMKPSEGFQPNLRKLKLDELDIPVFSAWLEPKSPPPEGPLLAFAGIGRPQKFIDALQASGGEIAETAFFPDHHAYSHGDLTRLSDLAEAHDAIPITTEKDWVRLSPEWRKQITAWPVRARFAEPECLVDMVKSVMDAHLEQS